MKFISFAMLAAAVSAKTNCFAGDDGKFTCHADATELGASQILCEYSAGGRANAVFQIAD